jgi:hypothetical protein
VELITEDDAPVKALKTELRALEARQEELEKALAVTTAPAPLIHPNLAEVYRQKVAALHEALDDPRSRDEAFDTIRSLIEEIRFVRESGRSPHRDQGRARRHPQPLSGLGDEKARPRGPGLLQSKSRWLRGEDLNL